jgi:hypothetical protein
MVPDHARARAGRHDHRPGLGEQVELRGRDAARLVGIAAAVRRLPAAALAARIVHGHAFAFQQAHRVEPGFGDEQVDQTGREQVDVRGGGGGVVPFVHVSLQVRRPGMRMRDDDFAFAA